MSVDYKTGDLFDPAFDFFAIGHGVNCMGVMGAGIAPVFKRLHPNMYDAYKSMCGQGFLLPGQVMPWKPSEGPIVYNIASQFLPGPNAKVPYLRVALEWVRMQMEQHDIPTLGLPRIGAGIGGLTYTEMADTVEAVFDDSVVNVTIVSLEGA